MSVDVREVDGVALIHPRRKRVTALSGADELREALHNARERGHLAIAIDFEGVEYADTAAIGMLIAEFKVLNRDHGLMCLFNVGPDMHEFFRQIVFDHLIEVRGTEQAALELFAGQPKRRHLSTGLRNVFSHIYSWSYKLGVTPERRTPGDRRVTPDRRRSRDRRSTQDTGPSGSNDQV